MDLFSLKGKNIAITGASSGFGHHFAGVLADAGARVILGARRTDKISDRVTEINENGGQAMGIPLDVTDPDSCAAFLSKAEETHGSVDVLINNAGVEAGAKTYAMIDEDDWDYVLDTNLKSRCTQRLSLRTPKVRATSLTSPRFPPLERLKANSLTQFLRRRWLKRLK